MFFYAASWYVYIKKVHTFYTLFWEKLGNNIIPLVICGEAVCSALVTVFALLFQVAGLDVGFSHSSFVPFHTQKNIPSLTLLSLAGSFSVSFIYCYGPFSL